MQPEPPPPPPEEPPIPIVAVFDGVEVLRITFDKALRVGLGPPAAVADFTIAIADVRHLAQSSEIEGTDVLKLTIRSDETGLLGSFVSYAAATPPILEGDNGLQVQAFNEFPVE